MAFKIWEGWDHYLSQSDMEQRSGFLQYQTYTNPPLLSFITPGRNGNGKSLRLITNFTNLQFTYSDRNAEAIVGMAVINEVTSGSVSGTQFCFLDTVAFDVQVTVHFNRANYSIEIWRGSSSSTNGFSLGTMLYASPNNQWTGDVWNFIEMDIKIDSSAGSAVVRVNGVTKVNQTGLNTKKTANTWWDALYMSPTGEPGGTSLQIDDHYYCDTTTGAGTFAANTFAGDCKVISLFPNGADSSQWTPLANANWQEVSETSMDSDVSYTYSSTPGQQDTFTFQPLANTISTIFGIQTTFAARKDDAGVRTVKPVTKISGVSYFGANHNLPDLNYAYFTDTEILSPATGLNWTLSDVNSATFGYYLTA